MVQEVYCTQQSVIIISLDGLRISRAEHSLVKLAPKRGHGHWLSAAGLTQYSFFNPGETTASEKCVQRTNEVHPKLQYLGYHWQTERFQFSTSNYTPNNTSKAEKHWALKFCLILHVLANWLPLLQESHKLFTGKHYHKQKLLSRVPWILKHGFLYNRNKLISHWQKCIGCSILILINKDVFEPGYDYNALRLTFLLLLI